MFSWSPFLLAAQAVSQAHVGMPPDLGLNSPVDTTSPLYVRANVITLEQVPGAPRSVTGVPAGLDTDALPFSRFNRITGVGEHVIRLFAEPGRSGLILANGVADIYTRGPQADGREVISVSLSQRGQSRRTVFAAAPNSPFMVVQTSGAGGVALLLRVL